MTNELRERLIALGPAITDILATSGAPGLSLGVVHKGEIIHTQHFGRRDASKSTPPDDDTIYHVASLTKGMTALTAGMLVEEGLLGWDVPIREYLPEFRRREDELGMKCTLRDLLSNRTGIAMANAMWGLQYGEFLLPRHEMIRMTTYLPTVAPFRKAFIYSAWNWGLVQEVIESVTGKSLDSVIRERIAEPLNLRRTTLRWLESDEDPNIALAHAVKNDGTPSDLWFCNFSDPTGHAASAGGKSTIRDLLTMYRSVLKAHSARKSGSAIASGPHFAQTETIFSPQVRVGNAGPIGETHYCLGLYRTRLPGNIGVASMNPMLLGGPKNVPFIGKTRSDVEVFHHTGTIPGFLSSCFLIPASETAVVVLTNALPLMDPTDFVGQSILAVLLGEEPPKNYPSLAKSVASVTVGAHARLAKALAKGKTDTPPSLPKAAFVGDYWNTAGNYVLTISELGQGLRMIPQRQTKTHFNLEPYDGNTFYWQVDRESEVCGRGMWPILTPSYHKILFGLSQDGSSIETLTWHHDPLGKPEVFRRKSDKSKL